jgi:Nuclease-related domain
MFMKKEKVRLPQVRRRAGESASEERERRVYDNLPSIIFVPLLFWFAFLIAELQQSNPTLRRPAFWFIFAVIVTVLSAVWLWRLFPIARRFNRGERGERHVADVLEELRSEGYKPVHDIVGNGFNVDHVLVGPGGVFAIETKYRSGKGEITVRNEGVFVGDRLEEKDCLKQACGSAATIRELIHESCGRRVWVNAIVVFVGDWKIRNKWRDANVRVFTPERLFDYIRDQQPQLTRRDIELIASHLERSVKS